MARLRTGLLGVILGVVPLVFAGLFVLKPWGESIPCTPKPLETWRDGSPKTLSCDWYDDGVSWVHYCARKPDQMPVGCWTEKGGVPWNGSRIEWYWYGKEHNPKEAYGVVRVIEQYEDGQRSGTWQVFYQTGVLMNEIVFEDGERVRFQSYGPDGKPIRRSGGTFKGGKR